MFSTSFQHLQCENLATICEIDNYWAARPCSGLALPVFQQTKLYRRRCVRLTCSTPASNSNTTSQWLVAHAVAGSSPAQIIRFLRGAQPARRQASRLRVTTSRPGRVAVKQEELFFMIRSSAPPSLRRALVIGCLRHLFQSSLMCDKH